MSYYSVLSDFLRLELFPPTVVLIAYRPQKYRKIRCSVETSPTSKRIFGGLDRALKISPLVCAIGDLTEVIWTMRKQGLHNALLQAAPRPRGAKSYQSRRFYVRSAHIRDVDRR